MPGPQPTSPFADRRDVDADRALADEDDKDDGDKDDEDDKDSSRLLTDEDAADDDAALEARIASFELSYRMQQEATEAFDTSREPKHILEMYGEGQQNRQLLMARRLVERGVRFVQCWHGKGQPWDSHNNIKSAHRGVAKACDQGLAALISAHEAVLKADPEHRGALAALVLVAVDVRLPRHADAELGPRHLGQGLGLVAEVAEDGVVAAGPALAPAHQLEEQAPLVLDDLGARPAPIAVRTAISRLRSAARAMNRFATFTHAIRSSSPTTAIITALMPTEASRNMGWIPASFWRIRVWPSWVS